MKKTTLSILLALVFVLSLSVVSAYAYEWDDNEVLTVMNDLKAMNPGIFGDVAMEGLQIVDNIYPEIPAGEANQGVTDGLVAKAAIDADPTTREINGTLTGSFDPCGDGTILVDMTINREDYTNNPVYGDIYRGNRSVTYIRSLKADVKVGSAIYTDLKISNCQSSGGDSCHAVYFDSKGTARLKGYIELPEVIDSTVTQADVVVKIVHSTYMTVLWDMSAEKLPQLTLGGIVYPSRHDYCQGTLEPTDLGGIAAVQGRYDENTGEARIRATLANKYSYVPAYAIPGEVWVNGSSYNNYVCKYTVYNSTTGYPKTDYCEYGKGIRLAQNEIVRFDISIPHVSGNLTGSQNFTFRVGGAKAMLTGILDPVSNPCPPESRISIMDPVRPFMTFFEQDPDDPIEPSGAYGAYEGAVWGMYEKCGCYAYVMVRLRNDSARDEIIYLDNVAVAINGGTPMSFKWVLSTQPEGKKGTIVLGPDADVILVGRAKVTEMSSQLNSDYEMTAAVNFLDYGAYLSGKVFSDRDNTRCYPAP